MSIDHPDIETTELRDGLASIRLPDGCTGIALTRHPGGGSVLSATLPTGEEVSVDIFPTLGEAAQELADLLGTQLGTRIELGSICTPSRRLDDLDDVTAVVEPRRLDLVPALEFSR